VTTGTSGTSGTTGDTGDTGITGLTGDTGASGGSGGSGGSGITGTTSSTTATGDTGDTGDTGASGSTGATGTTAATGDSGITGSQTATGSTGTTGGSGAPSATGPTGTTSTTGSTGPRRPLTPPVIVGGQSQPQTGLSPQTPSLGRHHGGSGSTSHRGSGSTNAASGPTAPPPDIFAGFNPLAGVLPGSWSDPFIVGGGAQVPQFYVQSFRVPPFLLSIYQAAGSAYGIPWQALAAINEVETNYGTNLNVSSAGAIGWMQFLPSTWRRYGVDASGAGARDPYNAADAIFAAARYLAAAGARKNLPRAIFAYNHSIAYVETVLARAQLLSGEPTALTGSVTELGEGDFPIQLGYHAHYAATPSAVASSGAATATGASANGTAPAPGAVGAATSPTRQTPSTRIFAASAAAVVAAQDGTVVEIGHDHRLGHFVVLRNAFGDRFTYANLATVSAWYDRPKPIHADKQLLSTAAPAGLSSGPRPTQPASAGAQPASPSRGNGALFAPARGVTHRSGTTDSIPAVATLNLRSSFNATTLLTPLPILQRAAAHVAATTRHQSRTPRGLVVRYFTGAFGLRPHALEAVRLRVGSHVLAGTILGRLARTSGSHQPHLLFQLRPAGPGAAAIDPRPFLDAWSQLATLTLARRSYATAYYGPNVHATSAATVLLASQVDLERIVLQDQHLTLPGCERAAIAAGNVDRRVLASLELLVLHGIDPTVSGAWCASFSQRRALPAVLKTGNAIALTALSGSPAAGSAATVAIDVLSGLSASARPATSRQTVSGELVIAFAPASQPRALAAAASFTSGFALSADRWTALDSRLAQIREPRVPTAISPAALRVSGTRRPS
jgi:Transglycosylase SLT domain